MTMVGLAARAAVLGAAGAGATGVLAWWLADGAVSSWPGAGVPVAVDEGFTVLASAAAAVVAAWASVLLARASLALVAEARRGAPRGAGAGLVGRVAAGLVVAAALGASPAAAAPAAPVVAAGPAAAAPSTADEPGRAEPAPARSTVPVPGWTPTVVATPPRTAAGEVGLVTTATTTTQTEEQQVVVVRRGDTLWSIAARSLGAQATDQDVAEAWPSWYAANRATIGEDPDLLLPGQQLVVPVTGADR